MIRIAFLGSDSTHTEAFANRINGTDAPFASVARVTSIWGEDPEQTAAKAKALGIEKVADFAMVIGRFADGHTQPALEAIAAGVPTFVDKPFTENAANARRLIEAARSKGVALCSSSPLRFTPELVSVRNGAKGKATYLASAPAACTDLGPDPRLNSAFFYGIHALEMLLELAGHDIAKHQITFGPRFIHLHLDMESGGAGSLTLVRDTPEFYSIGRIDEAGQQIETVELDGGYYHAELDHLLNAFVPGKSSIALESSLAAIELLEEIDTRDTYRS
jgi:predicted dehydrogenase